jgi:hypothetical protein
VIILTKEGENMSRKKTTTKSITAVIEAFKKGKKLRTPCIKSKGPPWWSQHGWYITEGIRDEVKVEGKKITYYLWGNPIAIKENNILTLDNCGIPTQLTGSRLSSIYYTFFPWSGWEGPVLNQIGITGKGWCYYSTLYGTIWHRMEDYPLQIKLKMRKIITPVDKEVYYLKLIRARCEYRIKKWHQACKHFGPIPERIKDKIDLKLMKIKLEAA